jgi:hypothetical protein
MRIWEDYDGARDKSDVFEIGEPVQLDYTERGLALAISTHVFWIREFRTGTRDGGEEVSLWDRRPGAFRNATIEVEPTRIKKLDAMLRIAVEASDLPDA